MLIALTFLQHTLIAVIAFIHVHFIGPKYTSYNIHISSNFNEYEAQLIQDAANEWEEKTGHIITYRIFYHKNLPKDQPHSLFLMRVNSASPIVRGMDTELSKNDPRITLGFYDPNYPIPIIFLVPDRLEDSEYFRAVASHELGHSIGLEHDPEEGNLMFEEIGKGSTHIERGDLIAFCRIYYCDVNKLPR